MSDSAERRQFWRAAFRSPVQFIDQTGIHSAELLDISLKGALMQMPPTWGGQMGDVGQVRLKLADDAAILMRGQVAHLEGQRLGLRCDNIDLDSITHLRRLVELNSGDPALLDRELQTLVLD